MLNVCTVMGRMVRDPEVRYTANSTPVCSFTIACERDFGEKQVDFIDCVAFKAAAEFVGKYFRKGQMILVNGNLQSRKWEDQTGNKRINWEINISHVYFASNKGDGANDDKPQVAKPQNVTYDEPEDEEGSLPF